MKAIFVILSALAASVLATPVLSERQLETQADEIDKLTAVVLKHTANISKTSLNFVLSTSLTCHFPDKTTAAAPENPDLLQQNAAAAALAPDFKGITDALASATTILSKRALGLEKTPRGGCGGDCLLVKVKFLIWEIACTLKFVIIKLGLGTSSAFVPSEQNAVSS